MKAEHIRFEENEEEWWKLWCRVYDKPWAILYHNPKLNEPIFNHATHVRASKDNLEVIDGISKWFTKRGVNPHIYVTPFYNESVWERYLQNVGYKLDDEMLTMLLTRNTGLRSSGFSVVEIKRDSILNWAHTYCLTFYGHTHYFHETLRILRRVLKHHRATLLAALNEDMFVGVMALLRLGKTLGLYCLGTLPDYRGEGVATELLRYAADRAREKGLKLILQTLSKDGLSDFYKSRGFTVQYSKRIYSWSRQ